MSFNFCKIWTKNFSEDTYRNYFTDSYNDFFRKKHRKAGWVHKKCPGTLQGIFLGNYKRNPCKNPENIAKTNHLVISDEISAKILYGSIGIPAMIS